MKFFRQWDSNKTKRKGVISQLFLINKALLKEMSLFHFVLEEERNVGW